MTGQHDRRVRNHDDPMERAVREVFRRQADRLTTPALPQHLSTEQRSTEQLHSVRASSEPVGPEPVGPEPVASEHVGPEPVRAEPAYLERARFSRGEIGGTGPRRIVLAAAAVVMVAGMGIGLLAGLTGDPNAIITDGPASSSDSSSEDASSTTRSTTPSNPSEGASEGSSGSSAGDEAVAEPSQDAVTVVEDPNTWLLADPDRWLMVSHRVVQDPVEQAVPGSSVHVYELGSGEFFILAVLPIPSAEDSQLEPNRDPETGRIAAVWETGGHQLNLVGHNVNEQEFVAFARSLDPQSDSWEVAGAVLRRSEEADQAGQSVPPISGPVIEVEYVPLDQDGRPVLSGRVVQRTRQGSPLDLYDRLIGDGGIGTLEIRSVAGADGAQVTGLGIEFGVRFSNGWLTTWDNAGGEPMMSQLLGDISLVDKKRWQAAVQDSVTAQSEAVEAAAAELSTIPSPDLARLVLPEPYELITVQDPSQWNEDERAQHEVEAEAERAQLQQVIVWAQSFRELGNEDAILPDVMVEVHDVRIQFPASAGDDDQPFSFGGFDGLYGPHSQGTAGLTMERGDLRIQLFSPTLSPEELADFVRSAGLRSDGTRGLATAPGFDLSAEGSLAFQDQAGWPSWETEWRHESDETLYISFHRQPSELADVMMDLQATWLTFPNQPMERPMDGERLIFVDTGQNPQVIWARPDLGGLISIFGPGALEAAEALDSIGEDEWAARVKPTLAPPQDGPGN